MTAVALWFVIKIVITIGFVVALACFLIFTKDGRVRVWCTDYSKEREDDEETNWTDHLSVTASSVEFTDFLQNEAFK